MYFRIFELLTKLGKTNPASLVHILIASYPLTTPPVKQQGYRYWYVR